MNGNVYYARIEGFATAFGADNGFTLWQDAALTTPFVSGASSGLYQGNVTYFVASEVTDYEYTFNLPEQSETLQLQANASTIVEYSSNRVNIQDDVFLNLPSASNTTILAYTNMSNGDMVYNSTDATVAVYAGGVWQNLQFSGNVA